MDCIDHERDLTRTRDHVAWALVVARAARAGLFDRLRAMPPCTADRVAGALGWQVGPTRAVLQALAAGGLLHHDPELSTWSLGGAPARRESDALAALASALDGAVAEPLSLDRTAVEIFPERILPAEDGLRAALERGARVVGLAGSEPVACWLAERYPGIESTRLEEVTPARPADLVLHLSPLAVPEAPDLWLADVAPALGSTGHLVLRVLRQSLAPPRRGRGWWHALAVAAALEGRGSGGAWSAAMARRAASSLGCGLPATYEWAADPDCVHLVWCRHSSSDVASPR